MPLIDTPFLEGWATYLENCYHCQHPCINKFFPFNCYFLWASMPRRILFPLTSRIVIVLLSSMTSFHRLEAMWLAERVIEVFDQEGQSTWTRNWGKRHEKGIIAPTPSKPIFARNYARSS
jgi:hypothetical protein